MQTTAPAAAPAAPAAAPLAALAEVARRQHGVFTRAQAMAAGLDDSRISRWAREERWIRLHRGVFRDAMAPDTWHGRAVAARLAVGGDAALARSTAAVALGLMAPRHATGLHVLVRSRRPRGAAGVTVHRSESFRMDHTLVVDGLTVTDASRTIVDLASVLPERWLRTALSEAVRRNLTDETRLARMIDHVGAVPGIPAVRTLLGELVPLQERTASELETRWLQLVTAAGLPPTHVNHRVRDGHGRVRYLDAVYLPERLVVELDGAAFHGHAIDVRADERRDDALRSVGWRTILRFTWWDVTQTPAQVVATVRAALAASRG